MKLWFFVISTLIIQERISTDTALFQARVHNLNMWLIHSIWLLVTIGSILGGFILGQFCQKKFAKTVFIEKTLQFSRRIEHILGKQGEKFAFILLGLVNFPYLNGFLASFLNIRLKNVFLYLFIGDAIWYISAWMVNIYIRKHFSNAYFGLVLVVITGICLGLIYKGLLHKFLKNK